MAFKSYLPQGKVPSRVAPDAEALAIAPSYSEPHDPMHHNVNSASPVYAALPML